MSWQEGLTREFRHAYAAGVLDARGLWLLVRRGKGWAPRIYVTVNPHGPDPIVDELTALFGGTAAKPRGQRHRLWQVSGAKGCLALNEAILPYAHRASRVIVTHARFCRRVVDYKRTAFDARRMPLEEVAFRRQLEEAFLKARQESGV